MYIKPINKTITLFKDQVKGTNKVSNKFLEVKHMIDIETITEQINKKRKYKSKMIYPFGEDCYTNIDDMFEKIKKECEKMVKNIFMHIMKSQIIQCTNMDQIVMW